MQEKPNNTKQKRLRFLGFTWPELGLFKGLQRIQIKKSSCLSTPVLGCAKRLEPPAFQD
jgi:hypothetical protein